jgi:hypothetical protein
VVLPRQGCIPEYAHPCAPSQPGIPATAASTIWGDHLGRRDGSALPGSLPDLQFVQRPLDCRLGRPWTWRASRGDPPPIEGLLSKCESTSWPPDRNLLNRPAGAINLPTVAGDRAALLAVVAQPAAHGCGARAKVTAAVSHAVAWRVTLGTEAVGYLELAVFGLRAIGCPARAVALQAGIVALKVPATAHASYRRSGGKRRRLPSHRLLRRRSRRTPSHLCRRGDAGARDRSSAPLCRPDARGVVLRSMGAQGALDSLVSISTPYGPGSGVRQHLRGHFFTDALSLAHLLDLR